jgi:hypothetical protein
MTSWPIALMQRDGVDPHDLKALIEAVRRALQRRAVQHRVARRISLEPAQ